MGEFSPSDDFYSGGSSSAGPQGRFQLAPGQTLRLGDGFGGYREYGGGSHSSALLLESFVRPARIIEIQPPNTVVPRRVLPGEDTEAFIEWGDKSRFASQADQPTEPIVGGGGGGGLNKKDKRKKRDPDEDGPEVLVYTEEKRETEDVRVENPDDPDQYVMVQRIKQIWFKGEKDGVIRRFDLKPPK